MGRAQLQHVLSMFLRMRNTTGRSVDDIHTNRVGIDLANTWLAALAPIRLLLILEYLSMGQELVLVQDLVHVTIEADFSELYISLTQAIIFRPHPLPHP